MRTEIRTYEKHNMNNGDYNLYTMEATNTMYSAAFDDNFSYKAPLANAVWMTD